ncbi:Tellurium resistance protein TerD [Bacillus cereus]|nr:Tellurium resistance protein TerD [Bacillus cereus]
MPIILEKGQKIDLTKGQPKVAKLQVGLGWDPIGQSGGFLSSLFGSIGLHLTLRSQQYNLLLAKNLFLLNQMKPLFER